MKDRIQALFSVDTGNCNRDFIRFLPDIYKHADIHVCMFGGNMDDLDKILPEKNIVTRIVMPSRYFNYSTGINILIKEIKNKIQRKSQVLLLDGWSVISPLQMIKIDSYKDTNFNKEFMTFNTYHDNSFEFYDSENPTEPKDKIHLAASRRLSVLTADESPKVGSPLILTNIELLYDIETGLEEELWTEKSRTYLIEQLKKIGLKEKKAEELNGIIASNPIYYNDQKTMKNRDEEIIDKLCIHNKSMVFINSNLNVIWGNPEKINSIKTKNGLPYWSSKYKSIATNISNKFTFNNNNKKPKTNIIKPQSTPHKTIETKSINTLTVTDIKLSIEKSSKVLLLVNNEIEDLISITPMIKRLYSLGFKVDILLEDILNVNTGIIDSFMVNKIYDRNNLRIGDLKPDQYNGNIIKTKNCNITLKYPLITDRIPHNNKVFENFSYIYGSKPFSEKNVFKPYCNWEQPKLIFKPNTFCVSSGINKKYINKLKDPVNNYNFEAFLGKFTNTRRDITIIVLNLLSETNTSILSLSRVKEKQNFLIYSNISPTNAAGIIKNCKFCITHSQSDIAWLTFGLRTPTLVLNHEKDDNPFTVNCPNMHSVFYNTESDLDTEIEDYIWSNII